MTFSLDYSLEILSQTPATLQSLLGGLSDEWTKNNEGPDTWSPYEVLGHLIHGEKTDWVPRARIILSNAPDKTFVPFDRFAQANEDQNKSITDLLAEFSSLRAENIQAIKAMQLTEEKLNQKGTHPALGPATLRELLSTWTVHDLGHIAQISRVMAKQYRTEVGPWSAYLGILKQ